MPRESSDYLSSIFIADEAGAKPVARAPVRHRGIRQRSRVRRAVKRLSRQNAVGDRSKPPLESIEMR